MYEQNLMLDGAQKENIVNRFMYQQALPCWHTIKQRMVNCHARVRSWLRSKPAKIRNGRKEKSSGREAGESVAEEPLGQMRSSLAFGLNVWAAIINERTSSRHSNSLITDRNYLWCFPFACQQAWGFVLTSIPPMGEISAHQILQQNVDEASIGWCKPSKRPLFQWSSVLS